MTPRTFVCGLAALVASIGSFGHPSPADAQQPASPRRIGVLLVGFPREGNEVQQFRQGLVDAGYSEGRDVMIEWRSANADYARLPALAAGLVKSKVEVIVVDSTIATGAAKRVTSTIPVVMATVADPVGSGLVASLAHPGGNVTGLSIMGTDRIGKRLHQMQFRLSRGDPNEVKLVRKVIRVATAGGKEDRKGEKDKPAHDGPSAGSVIRPKDSSSVVVADAPGFIGKNDAGNSAGVFPVSYDADFAIYAIDAVQPQFSGEDGIYGERGQEILCRYRTDERDQGEVAQALLAYIRPHLESSRDA